MEEQKECLTEEQLKRRQYGRTHYVKHREKIIAHLMRKVLCECGCIQTYANLSRHRKTPLHNNRLQRPEKYKQYTEDDL